jgi:hypothetical protein
MTVRVHMAIQPLEKDAMTHSWDAKGRTNAIGALMDGLLLAISLFQFNINADVFYACVTQDLLPKLPIGSIVVWITPLFTSEKILGRKGISLNSCPLVRPILILLISHGRDSNPFATKHNVPLMIFSPKLL